MSIQSFRDLVAWQLGIELVERIYILTGVFPADERFGLTSQLRRAAVAIPSNISEGHQMGRKAYLHFVVIAIGSLAEAETQIEIARRLKFADDATLGPVTTLCGRLRVTLHGLKRSLSGPKSLIPDP